MWPAKPKELPTLALMDASHIYFAKEFEVTHLGSSSLKQFIVDVIFRTEFFAKQNAFKVKVTGTLGTI